MSALTQLEAEFKHRAIAPDGFFLLKVADAEEYIRRGQSVGLRLLGIEGFRITEQGAFKPVQEWSNDIACYTGTDFVKDTLAFIRTLDGYDATFQIIFQET